MNLEEKKEMAKRLAGITDEEDQTERRAKREV
jgi:hypothetical protein